MSDNGTLLEVGAVIRPHGLRGECIVALVTNRLERLDAGTMLVAAWPPEEPPEAPGGRRSTAPSRAPARGVVAVPAVGPGKPKVLEVSAARPHQGRFIVSFAGVTDREGAERLRGARLLAPPIEGDPDAWFVHELIGCQVVDLAGRSLGTVTGVEANPASDLLVLDDRHLVPLRFVVERAAGRLVADLPDGLLE